MQQALVALCLCLPALGQATYSGYGIGSGSALYGAPGQGLLAGENVYCAPGSSGELTEGMPTWGATDGPANLPSQCMNTALSSTPSPGGTVAVSAGDATGLQNVINAATCGQTITIVAGSSYTAPANGFQFPALSCDGGHWVTVRSTGTTNANFPGEGARATPCLAGVSNDAVNGYNAPGYPPYSCPSYPTVLTAKLQTTGLYPAMQFVTNSSHWRFIGIEVTKQADVKEGALVVMAPDGQTEGANHVIFDRSVIHGQPWTLANGVNGETQGGIKAKNSQWVALINSWDYDTYCDSFCIDSQNFSAGSGSFQDGPFKLYGNLLATAGMSIEFGGGGQGPGTPNTEGLEYRANHITKPLGWMVPIGSCYLYNVPITKNLLEFKNGTHAVIEGNYFENSWQGCQSDQSGHALLIDPRNQEFNQTLQVTFDGTDMVVTTPGPKLFKNQFGGGQWGYPDDAANCPVGGCHLNINDTGRPDNGAKYIFCNGTNGCDQTGTTLHTDGKSARLVTPASGPAPAGTATGDPVCNPGLDPSAATNNVVVRYNEFYNVTNGIVAETTISGCGDEAMGGLYGVSIHDNYLHGLSVEMGNDSTPYSFSAAFQVENGQIYQVVHAVGINHNTVAVEANSPGAPSNGAFGEQREGQDSRYMQGLSVHDNVSPDAWHISHGSGALMNGGLANNFQTDACTAYYPNDANGDTDGNGNVLNNVGAGTTFTFSPALAHYIVTKNGTIPATSSNTSTSFVMTGTLSSGDALTVRDVTACDWTFVGNIMGEGLPGSGKTEDPYPNGTDPYSGLATPNANNSNNCGTGGTQACILSGSAFTSIFNSWDARAGDLGIASSTYKGTATDAGSRGATGKDPGTDFATLSSLLTGVHASAVYKSLSISSGTLTAATHNVAYQNDLATPDYGATGGGASPYKSWWQETDTSHCGGNCGTTPAALVTAGIIIGRDGTVNGPFVILTAARASGVSTLTPKMQMVSEMPATSTIPWQVGQVVTLSGFVDNGSGNAAHDSSFNGTCTISSVATNNFSCTQSGTGYDNINSHTPYHAQGGTPAGVATFAPITPGSYQFWMGVKDGAFQKAWAQIAVTVN